MQGSQRFTLCDFTLVRLECRGVRFNKSARSAQKPQTAPSGFHPCPSAIHSAARSCASESICLNARSTIVAHPPPRLYSPASSVTRYRNPSSRCSY